MDSPSWVLIKWEKESKNAEHCIALSCFQSLTTYSHISSRSLSGNSQIITQYLNCLCRTQEGHRSRGRCLCVLSLAAGGRSASSSWRHTGAVWSRSSLSGLYDWTKGLCTIIFVVFLSLLFIYIYYCCFIFRLIYVISIVHDTDDVVAVGWVAAVVVLC